MLEESIDIEKEQPETSEPDKKEPDMFYKPTIG